MQVLIILQLLVQKPPSKVEGRKKVIYRRTNYISRRPVLKKENSCHQLETNNHDCDWNINMITVLTVYMIMIESCINLITVMTFDMVVIEKEQIWYLWLLWLLWLKRTNMIFMIFMIVMIIIYDNCYYFNCYGWIVIEQQEYVQNYNWW